MPGLEVFIDRILFHLTPNIFVFPPAIIALFLGRWYWAALLGLVWGVFVNVMISLAPTGFTYFDLQNLPQIIGIILSSIVYAVAANVIRRAIWRRRPRAETEA